MKFIFLTLILLISETVIADENGRFESFKRVANPEAAYFYSDTYFHKENSNFEADFSKCHRSQLEYIKSGSQGYKVLKSFGQADQEIISKGVKDCLFVNNWKQYRDKNGELQELMFGNLYFKTKISMTEEEIKKSKLDLIERKKWYEKYAPELIK